MTDIFQKGSGATTVSLSATTSSGNIALTGANFSQCRVAVNGGSGANFVYIAFGTDNTVAATSADYAMLPGSVETFTIGFGITYIAALTDTGTATVKAITGIGG